MLSRKKSRLWTIIRLAVLLYVLWYLSPLVFPIYKWIYVDFEHMSRQTGIPTAELNRIHTFVVRFNPRFKDDPAAWEIMRMSPEWIDLDSPAWPKRDEYELAVRVRLLSTYTGEPPGTMFMSKLQKRRYFLCQAYRFPPKVLDQQSSRPILLVTDRELRLADPFEVYGMMHTDRWESIDEHTDAYLE